MTQTIELNSIDELQGLFDGITKQAESINWTKQLQAELSFIADLEKSYFDKSAGPDGAPWVSNAPRTIKQKGHSVVLRGKRGIGEASRKRTKHTPTVKVSRARNIAGFRLATSLTTKTTQSSGDSIREAVSAPRGGALKFGTTVPYSVFNDQGTDRIPARPHIGLNDQYLNQATNRIVDYALQQLKQ